MPAHTPPPSPLSVFCVETELSLIESSHLALDAIAEMTMLAAQAPREEPTSPQVFETMRMLYKSIAAYRDSL